MRYRTADNKDIKEIYSLWKELMDYHKTFHPAFVTVDKPREYFYINMRKRMLNENTKIFICEEDGKIIGLTITFYSEGSPAFILYKKGYIAETAVSEKHRGRGIGKKLYEIAEKWLREKGADHIELQVSVENKNALNFWANQGFTPATQHLIKEL